MVVEPTFLIDATFLLESAEKAFLGSTPIRNSRGQDTSVVYGAVRGLLGLRKAMGIAQGIVVIGRDAGGVSSLPNIEQFRNCLRAIGASVWHEAAYGIGPLCKEFIKQYQDQMWIISGDKSLLQLICSNCGVILIAEGSDPEVINEDSLYLRYNIRPNQVPIFFALTETSQGNRLTAKQAMRLLEVCGTAGAGFEIANPNSLSPKTRHHILANKAAWLRRLKELTITDDSVSARKVPIAPLARIDVESRNTFKEYGFPSLARHLIPTAIVQLIAEHCERKSAYVAVIDRVGLLKLKDVLAGATICAIDTESTSKDPRKAILLGVALSTEPGNAFYVPLTKPDLQNISAAEATATLQDILGQKLMIIGHNLKYDYVLLRRNGIRIATPHFDTMLAAYECFGDWDFFNLGAVAKRILNINLKRYRDIVKPSQRFEDIPFKEQLQHGCADVDATLKLYAPLRKLLKEKRIEHQFISDVMPLMNLLGDKEVDGVQVNPDALNSVNPCGSSRFALEPALSGAAAAYRGLERT